MASGAQQHHHHQQQQQQQQQQQLQHHHHQQQQQHHQQQQQTDYLMQHKRNPQMQFNPIPRPLSLTPNSSDQIIEQQENDHEQIIDQVISLQNDFSDTSCLLTDIGQSSSGVGGIMMSPQHQHHQLQHQQLSCGANRFSPSSEDLLDLLLEFGNEQSNNIVQDDQDEKVGIENIRKQLMSCEMQSETSHHQESVSPIVNQMSCQPQQARGQVHQQQQLTQQLVPHQTAPVISHHQQQQQQQQQQLQMPMSMNNSPSLTWQQQPQLSPYSPQNTHDNSRTTSQHHPLQHQQQLPIQQHQQPIASPHLQQQLHHPIQHHQMQQLQHNPLQQLHHQTIQQTSPCQSVSPPTTTEPSPVVKKNPLLNAQLVNSRVPSSRFMNNQTNVLNQNPILNAKLSQGPFVITSTPTSSPNPQTRFFQQSPQPQQQQMNFEQHTPQQQAHNSMYGASDQQQQQQQPTQVFRTNTAVNNVNTSASSINMGNLSQQVKQEIRRKVQQPKQTQQTTSLLKQLLSDNDNK